MRQLPCGCWETLVRGDIATSQVEQWITSMRCAYHAGEAGEENRHDADIVPTDHWHAEVYALCRSCGWHSEAVYVVGKTTEELDAIWERLLAEADAHTSAPVAVLTTRPPAMFWMHGGQARAHLLPPESETQT